MMTMGKDLRGCNPCSEIGKAILRGAACALVVSVAACFPEHRCNLREVAVVRSPNGEHMVSISDLSCKPEVQKVLATHVAIFNVKVPPPGRLEYVFKINGDFKVNAVWLDDTHLRVECPGGDPRMVETRMAEWDGVTITYSF